MTIKGYLFYIRPVTDPESEWVAANGVPQENPDYQYIGLASGTDYEIAGRAVDLAGNESELSVPLQVSTPVHHYEDEPMNAIDAATVDAIIAATMGSAKGAVVSVSGPKGYRTKAYGNDYTSAGAAGRALTIDDKMHYGSTTKMNTAWLICRQIDAGNLNFSDTLDMFEATTGVTNGDIITIKHLLMNRSGVQEVVGAASAFGQASYLNPTGVGDPMPYIRAAPSMFPPGTAYEYSNSNWILLGEVLRQLDIDHGTGRSVADIVRQDCYDTLGLTESEWRTGPYMTPPYSRGWNDNQAYPTIVATITSLPLYWLLGSIYWSLAPSLTGGWPITPTYEFTAYDPSWPGTAGCLDGTISDLRKWGEKLRDGALLSDEMNQLRAETFGTYAVYTPQHIWEGVGWMGGGLGLMSWGDWRGWNGASAGYSSALWFNVVNGAVIAIMHNYFGLKPWDAAMRIAYSLWPDSTLHNLDWTLRMATGIDYGADEFGTGSLWPWQPTGDADGTTQVPHKVPFTV